MFGAILKATNGYLQKGMAFCRSIYVNKVMKLLAFIFEQPSNRSHITIIKELSGSLATLVKNSHLIPL